MITRRGYAGRGVESVFPLDAELNLPLDKYSHGLREVLVEGVVRGGGESSGALRRRADGETAGRGGLQTPGPPRSSGMQPGLNCT
jgi:hypothetical protein